MRKQLIFISIIFTVLIAIVLFNDLFSAFFLLLVLIGILASFIGTLAGGGGLITLPAMMLTGIPIHTSIATNKFSSGIAAFTSVFYLINEKQFTWNTIIKYIIAAFLGGASGALFITKISEKNMHVIVFILLVIALVVSIKNREWSSAVQQEHVENLGENKWVVPFFISVYDGGFGPGSSTFSILYFLKKHYTYIKSVQFTRVIIFGSCTGAFLVFFQTDFFQLDYAIAMAIGSIIGSQLGLWALPKVPLKIARGLLIVIVCLLIVQVLLKLL